MKVLITGSNGFIGKNLKVYLEYALKNTIDILSFTRGQTQGELDNLISRADFIIHLAGENRPKDAEEFKNNYQLTKVICNSCEKSNPIPILYASTTQIELDNDYGLSKKQAEEFLKDYSNRNKVPVYIYRLPNVFGKWCKPNYNSVIATWCSAILRNQEIHIDNRGKELKLVYIDDLVESFKECLITKTASHHYQYREVGKVYSKSLGEIADLLFRFKQARQNLELMPVATGFEKALYSTFLSYLPEDDFAYSLKSHVDDRGKFVEIFKMSALGQLSMSSSKPGVVRGEHFHHSKNEKFMVLKGSALVKFRRLSDDKLIEYELHEHENKVIDIPVGYTHNIKNIGHDELILLIWANEAFDKNKPDTHPAEV